MSRNERARTTVSFFFLIQITLMRLVPLTPTVFTFASGKGAERLVHLWKILSPKYAGLVGRATVRDSENLSLGLTQILTKPLYSFLHILN